MQIFILDEFSYLIFFLLYFPTLVSNIQFIIAISPVFIPVVVAAVYILFRSVTISSVFLVSFLIIYSVMCCLFVYNVIRFFIINSVVFFFLLNKVLSLISDIYVTFKAWKVFIGLYLVLFFLVFIANSPVILLFFIIFSISCTLLLYLLFTTNRYLLNNPHLHSLLISITLTIVVISFLALIILLLYKFYSLFSSILKMNGLGQDNQNSNSPSNSPSNNPKSPKDNSPLTDKTMEDEREKKDCVKKRITRKIKKK